MTVERTKFKLGDRVKVRMEDRRGHIRTPWYIRGKSGWIERVYGEFLYLVAFNQADVWGKSVGPKDKVLADIYEHWLDPAA